MLVDLYDSSILTKKSQIGSKNQMSNTDPGWHFNQVSCIKTVLFLLHLGEFFNMSASLSL